MSNRKRAVEEPTVPRVNLADPDVDPTDEELEALTRAMRRTVLRKDAELAAMSREKLAQAMQGANDADSSAPSAAST